MENGHDDLTPEQTEKLLQFQDLTGIEELQRCRETLQAHGWNIEAAVQDTFNEQEGAPTVYNNPPPPPPRPDDRPVPVNVQPVNQRVILYPGRRPQGIFEWTYYLLTMPIRFVWSTFFDIIKTFVSFLRPDPRRNVTDPVGDVVSFITEFNTKFGPNHPVMYQGTYSQALNDAKRELKFLLVYLHSEEHQNTEAFCREVLCNEEFVDFVNAQMLFWACNTSKPEGYRVSQALRENAYPFLAVIVLRDNRMSMVARIEGRITGATELKERLEQVMSENESSLIAARADREERSFNQSLRQEQDAAYLESLRADQEKERKKREEREKQEEAERQVKLEEEKKHQEFLEKEQRKSMLEREIPDEPVADHPNAIRILLRVPSGSRIERRFLRDQSLKHLHNYVFCHKDCPDDFQIMTNFPRKTLPCNPSEADADPPSFEEAGLGKSEMLFVHDNEA